MRFAAVPLAPRDSTDVSAATFPRVWAGSINEEVPIKDSQFYVAISAKMAVADLIKNAPRYLKVAAPIRMPSLIRGALPGVALRHVGTVPHEIPANIGSQYFRLHQSGVLWDDIVNARQIAIFIPSEIAEPQIELVAAWE
jgi:type VI secretion system protein ImpJ